MDFIVRQKGFWAEDDENVLRAIHTGFIETHQAMWKEIGKKNTHLMKDKTVKLIEYSILF